MKTTLIKSLFSLLTIFSLAPTLVEAQKFSTQAGYEKYFIESYNQLDKFEGIWKKVLQAKILLTHFAAHLILPRHTKAEQPHTDRMLITKI